MKFSATVSVLLASAFICLVRSEGCGEVACPFLYSPVCARGADKIWKHYNNECEFKSCGGATTFELSCATTATNATACSC